MEEGRQKIKDQILHLLKMRGAQSAMVLAEALRVSPMAIRQHLQTLKAEGLVVAGEDRRPLGRPVKLWQLTQQATVRFPDSHADLMVDLLRNVETVFGVDGIEKLLAERSRRQIQLYQSRLAEMGMTDDWQQQVEGITRLRSQEGYMAEMLEHHDGGVLLVENHCPICTAAQSCIGLCKAELGIFKAVLGANVTVERVEHILQGDRRCTYHVRPCS